MHARFSNTLAQCYKSRIPYMTSVTDSQFDVVYGIVAFIQLAIGNASRTKLRHQYIFVYFCI